jgi:DNA-3-methyladenine glycosylase II
LRFRQNVEDKKMARATTSAANTKNPADRQRQRVVIRHTGPFDLRLSLEAAASFFPAAGPPPTILRTPVQVDGATAVVEVSQSPKTAGTLQVSSTLPLASARLRALARWLTSAELDLRPFYSSVAAHPVMAGVVRELHGLKPLPPATLLEMAVIAITEQQLSLAAAFHIRSRLIRRFGKALGDLWAFPSPERLAAASLAELGKCGLSRRKAEYVKGLARQIAKSGLDFEMLREETDEQIRDTILSFRGFGEWSVQYILGRGFGRLDSLPSADTGLRRVVGYYFGGGHRLTAKELEAALAPFKPFRGLAAFYLAVHWRLRRCAKPLAEPLQAMGNGQAAPRSGARSPVADAAGQEFVE